MAEWPLCGRDREIAHVTQLLEDPDGRGLVLSGPAGVGKTRLGQECARIADEHGCAVIRVPATYATSHLPLGAVILSGPSENTVVVAPHEQAEAVHKVAHDLVRKANGRRLVMLVDDVHWLDQLSAVLVHQMAVTGMAFVVLTARTGVTVPDPIVALWKDGAVERVSVAAVSREAVEALLTTVLDGPVAGAAVAELADRSEGNLLFLRHLVLAGMESGGLRQDAGVWQLAPASGAPPRLVELVESRLAGLEVDERACLELIAFGEPLELSETIALTDETLVQRLEKKGLVSVSADGWGGAKVLLAHSMFGEVLRAETSVIRARRITAGLAEAAEARRPARPDELLRIATWRLVCGGGEPDMMHAAATAAYGRHDYDLAARLASAAVAVGGGFASRLLMAESHGSSGHRDEAERELSTLATEATGPDQQAAVAYARLRNSVNKGDHYSGLRVYREALESITDPARRAELRAQQAVLVIVQEGPRGALRATDDLWSESLEGAAKVNAATIRCFALGRSGQVSQALAAAESGRAAQQLLTVPMDINPAVHDFVACEALAFAGRIEEWERQAQRGYDDAIRDHSASMQLYFVYQLAKANLARGLIRTAVRLTGEAVGIAHQINDGILLLASLTIRAEALALCGDVDGASRALAESESLQQFPWLFTEPAVARAWLSVANGDLVTARRTLEGEVERSMAWDDYRSASLALHSLVRLGESRIARDPLQDLAQRVEGDLVPTQARHATAVLNRDGEELEAVGGQFARISAMLLAAEAYCDAASAFRHNGEPKRAATLAQKATKTLDLCEGARTPATRALDLRAELTQAERRTAMLAGQGMSNKDIAAVEYVSVRTVESRLQCVYTKLGISSRTELAEQFTGHEAP
jgi:DNA-binding CsgD family transcriptional regulator